MNHDSNSASFDDFEREHEKRDKKTVVNRVEFGQTVCLLVCLILLAIVKNVLPQPE